MPFLVAPEPLEVAFKDVEDLICTMVHMGWRCEAGGHAMVDDGHAAVCVLPSHLVDRERVEKPERVSIVVAQHEAATSVMHVITHALLHPSPRWCRRRLDQ